LALHVKKFLFESLQACERWWSSKIKREETVFTTLDQLCLNRTCPKAKTLILDWAFLASVMQYPDLLGPFVSDKK